MERILILGGTGWLGREIALAGRDVGAEVVCLARGGRVLTPTTEGRFVQIIDVADLARWVVQAGGTGCVGRVNAVGPSHTFSSVLEQAREVTGFDGEFVAVSDEELLAHNVAYWAGPRSLPLWFPAPYRGFAQRDGSSFLANGGEARPLPVTLSRVLDDEQSRGISRNRKSGLTEVEEREVLAAVGLQFPVRTGRSGGPLPN
ncbi:hypothetical protein [Actinomyces minihominis]|uniref:hypothetical protein n=1 Tax=Actinomyces minihominis TaxID=2002838 RepID=UPI000C076255|nr:hypothetical protein [Actinomyces minihominis]